MRKRYYFDPDTGEVVKEETPPTDDKAVEEEREREERDARFGHHPGGQYL